MTESTRDRTAAATPRCRSCGASLRAAPRFCTACGTPIEARADRQVRSRLRRTIFWIVALALVASVAVAGYLRYTSTTCQLRRAFDMAGWTCGHV